MKNFIIPACLIPLALTACATSPVQPQDPPTQTLAEPQPTPEPSNPTLDEPNLDELSPMERYDLGREAWNAEHFEQALAPFRSVADDPNAPENLREYAANLYLDSLNNLQRYDELKAQARTWHRAGFGTEEFRSHLLDIANL